MDIIQLYFEGHIDVIYDNFTPDKIIGQSSFEIMCYIITLRQYNQWKVIHQVLEQLKLDEHPDYQNIYDLTIYPRITIVHHDIKQEILQRFELLETTDDNLKIMMLRVLSTSNGIDLDTFHNKCQEHNLDHLKYYHHIKLNSCSDTGIIKRENASLNVTAFDKSLYSEVERQLNEDIQREPEELIILKKYLVEFYHKRTDTGIDNIISTVHDLSILYNLVFPYDMKPVLLNYYANKIRVLGYKDIAITLFDYIRTICDPTRWEALSFSYLCTINNNKLLINWYETTYINRSIAIPTNMNVDYLSVLYYSGDYKKYIEAYNKYKNITEGLTPISKFILNFFQLRYLIKTQQIYTVSSLEHIDDEDVIRLRESYVNFYNKSIETSNNIVAIIISKGFLIQEYIGDEFECSTCLENINSITTTVKCPRCLKQLGHSKCLLSWFLKNDSCPLCRFKSD